MNPRFILLFAILLLYPGIAGSAEYYTTISEVNVRIKAGTQYPVAFTLARGAEVEVLTKNQGWYHIQYSDKSGYVSAKLLERIPTRPDGKPQPSQSAESEFPSIVYFVALFLVCWWVYRKMRYRKPKRTTPRYYRGISRERSTSAEIISSPERGTSSELELVSKLIAFGIPREHIFHDLYIAKNPNEFAQADLVVLTQVGLLVIEVKEYSGWIFGSGDKTQWTQVMAYGRQKYYFYNPILQNQSHIAQLKKHLRQFGDMPYYSIVVFFGDCEFKSINYIPPGNLIVKANRVSEAFTDILTQNRTYVYQDKDEVIRILKEAVAKGGDRGIQQQHIENIKDKLGTDRIYD